MKKRLFFGIPFPDDDARALADAAAQALAACRARIEAPGNLHVTVRFLGDVEVERIDPLIAAARDAVAEVPAFSFELRDLHLGPPGGPPRMLWAGFKTDPGFEALCGAVRRSSDDVVSGLRDTHPPTPHATLARIHVPDCAGLVSLPPLPPIAGIRVGECVLYESKIGHGGPVYLRLASFLLAG